MPVTPSRGAINLIAGVSDTGERLDTFVAARISELSRSQVALLIQNESIKVNDQAKKPGYRIHSGDTIRGVIPPPAETTLNPEPLKLDILYEDDDVILINKAAGMVVHPAPGHEKGTLVNALLYHCPEIGPIGGEIRPGIVHRLDKDTSGLLVVAKNAAAHTHLSAQFAQRSVRKQYQAIVFGDVKDDTGRMVFPIGRHPVDRKRMSIQSRSPRAAETHWRVQERFEGLTLLALDLKTGRTHQARVHSAAIGHPIVGDPMYAGRKSAKRVPVNVYALIKPLSRQMLHARQLEFIHPSQGIPFCLKAPLPDDMKQLIAQLRLIKK